MAPLIHHQTETEKQPPLTKHRRKKKKKKKQQLQEEQKPKPKQPSSWDHFKNLFSCKQIQGSNIHDPQYAYSKLGSSCNSICSFRDVVRGNTRVVHRPDNSPDGTTPAHKTRLLAGQKPVTSASSTRALSGSTRSKAASTCPASSKAMQFRKLSGCYECHMIVDPTRSSFAHPLPMTSY